MVFLNHFKTIAFIMFLSFNAGVVSAATTNGVVPIVKKPTCVFTSIISSIFCKSKIPTFGDKRFLVDVRYILSEKNLKKVDVSTLSKFQDEFTQEFFALPSTDNGMQVLIQPIPKPYLCTVF